MTPWDAPGICQEDQKCNRWAQIWHPENRWPVKGRSGHFSDCWFIVGIDFFFFKGQSSIEVAWECELWKLFSHNKLLITLIHTFTRYACSTDTSKNKTNKKNPETKAQVGEMTSRDSKVRLISRVTFLYGGKLFQFWGFGLLQTSSVFLKIQVWGCVWGRKRWTCGCGKRLW